MSPFGSFQKRFPSSLSLDQKEIERLRFNFGNSYRHSSFQAKLQSSQNTIGQLRQDLTSRLAEKEEELESFK